MCPCRPRDSGAWDIRAGVDRSTQRRHLLRDAYCHVGQGSSAAEAARRRAAQVAAAQRLYAAQEKQRQQLKLRLAHAVGAPIKIAPDELDITANIDCFAKGDLAACGETALNVMLSFAGGVLGKIASRYGSPWKWAKAAQLVGAVSKLVGTVVKAVKDIFKVGDEILQDRRAVNIADDGFEGSARYARDLLGRDVKNNYATYTGGHDSRGRASVYWLLI
jgi:hypothetical protein